MFIVFFKLTYGTSEIFGKKKRKTEDNYKERRIARDKPGEFDFFL